MKTQPPGRIGCRVLLALAVPGILGLLPGCTSRSVMEFVVPECRESGDHPQSRAAACMTRAVYEIAEDKAEESKKVDAPSVNAPDVEGTAGR